MWVVGVSYSEGDRGRRREPQAGRDRRLDLEGPPFSALDLHL